GRSVGAGHRDMLAVGGRGGHVGAEVGLPQFVLAGDVAGAAGAEADEGPAAGAGGEDIPADHERRRDGAVGGIVRGIEASDAPEFLTTAEIVSRNVIASRDDELQFAVDGGELRGRVVVGRLALGVGGTLDLPDGLADILLDSEYVGGIGSVHAVEDLDVEAVAVAQGRGSGAGGQAKTAIVGLNVAFPNLGAVLRHAGGLAVSGHDPNPRRT